MAIPLDRLPDRTTAATVAMAAAPSAEGRATITYPHTAGRRATVTTDGLHRGYGEPKTAAPPPSPRETRTPPWVRQPHSSECVLDLPVIPERSPVVNPSSNPPPTRRVASSSVRFGMSRSRARLRNRSNRLSILPERSVGLSRQEN